MKNKNIMDSPVDEIKRRLSIEEVIGSYIGLRPAGKSLTGLCPFHTEKTPSFSVSKERQSYYCFGCHAGGDMFTFIQDIEGIDFKGALKILADKAGVDLSQYRGKNLGQKEPAPSERLYALMEEAAKLYAKTLTGTPSACEYLQQRGIDVATIEAFRLGFAPESWDFILKGMKSYGFTEDEMERTGLLVKKDAGGYFDRFRNRIMFPINDSSGRVIGFSGRTLSVDKKVAKYLNSPETPLFKKRDVLYGIDKAKLTIRKLDFSILVEGQMDLVLSHQSGFRNTVATSGTALSDASNVSESGVSNLELVRRISKNAVIAFDSDKAGITAALKNARLAFSLGMNVKIAVLPEGKDPADCIKEGSRVWKEIIKNSKDALEFHVEHITQTSKDKKNILRLVSSDVFETLRCIPNNLEREHYLGVISEMLGISRDLLRDEYSAFESSSKKREGAPFSAGSSVEEKGSPSERSEHDFDEAYSSELLVLACRILLIGQSEEVAQEEVDFYKDAFKKICDNTIESYLETVEIKKKERVLFELEKSNETTREQKSNIEYLLKKIRIGELENKSQTMLIELKEAEYTADKQKVQEIFSKYSKLLSEIENLKKQI